MTTTHTAAELNAEALRNLGKPYLRCTEEEREAVDFGVTSGKLRALMRERGATTLGELFASEAGR